MTTTHHEKLKDAMSVLEENTARDGDIWVLESGLSGAFRVRLRVDSDPRPKTRPKV